MIKVLENGISLNYEHFGNMEGYPLLFLHGNGENLDTFAFFFDKLQDYSLYFIDSRCHGKSSFSILTYDTIKNDIELFVKDENIDRYSIIGFSDGAIVGILMSLECDNIDKLFLIGPNLSPEGLTSKCIEYLKQDYLETKSIYSKLCLEEPNIDKDDLRKVSARAIIIGGENDLIRKDHLELIAESFTNSALYIIPSADHFIPFKNQEELYKIIENELSINVYYEDSQVIVVEKEAGILSQEDESKDADILSLTKKYLKIKYNKPGNVYLGLIQRLDRNVSGLMIFSKTSKASKRLNEMRPIKTYLAVVYGKLQKEEDTLVDYISKDEGKKIAYSSEDGKIAILKYKVLNYDEKQDLSLLKVYIETGRFHQIRFQLSNIGHPIFNDIKYKSMIERTDYKLGLDAYKLEFIHPVTKQKHVLQRCPRKGIFKNYTYYIS
ncbi:alpha/beta fold hydrolase [bacterium]|nr:alpha/beta fold hydrolase [bacterium]